MEMLPMFQLFRYVVWTRGVGGTWDEAHLHANLSRVTVVSVVGSCVFLTSPMFDLNLIEFRVNEYDFTSVSEWADLLTTILQRLSTLRTSQFVNETLQAYFTIATSPLILLWDTLCRTCDYSSGKFRFHTNIWARARYSGFRDVILAWTVYSFTCLEFWIPGNIYPIMSK